MRKPVKVYLFGSENNGWALDTDLALTRESLLQIPETVRLTSLAEADVVHSVWEEPLFTIDQDMLAGKRIVCHVCNDLMRLYENPVMIRAADTVGLWVGMSRASVRELKTLDHPHHFVPYSVNTGIFKPASDTGVKNDVREKYEVPADAFVISNFMRDSFGHDLHTPKDQKGVELLLEIGRCLAGHGIPIHYLLAGPRRHWLRNQLRLSNIPFTFVGRETEQDDLGVNIQPPEVIRELYLASDCHLITSRWEGGPRSVLEAAATRTPICSTPVGTAPDILHETCLFGAIDEAVEKLQKHYESGFLDDTLDQHFQTIEDQHTASANAARFEDLYRNIQRIEPYRLVSRWVEQPSPQPTLVRRLTSLMRSAIGGEPEHRKLCVSLWHTFHKPPYGGGNQFMMALQGAMERQGVKVVTNKLSRSVDVHISNSCWFDYEKFENKAADYPIRMIHRIDGPVTLYRGEGREVDETIFALNRKLASATVFQSAYCFRKSCELGFKAVSPVVIHNGVDHQVFNAGVKARFGGEGKIRLISSAWSDNPRKGGAFLKWLDGVLDWNRFEYTFVGRVKERFQNIEHIQAVPSERLAEILRKHDIYISVSLHEPCSNALLEALSCGLPALFRDDGGNPELVSFGGLPFTDETDILEKLDRLAEYYDSFKNLVYLRSIDNIAKRYIKLAEKICDWQV
ncbi:glycosyltransferase family 4 protein [Thermodesulfobacteriota bacterium]